MTTTKHSNIWNIEHWIIDIPHLDHKKNTANLLVPTPSFCSAKLRSTNHKPTRRRRHPQVHEDNGIEVVWMRNENRLFSSCWNRHKIGPRRQEGKEDYQERHSVGRSRKRMMQTAGLTCGTAMCQCSTSTVEKSYGCTVVDMPESKDRLAGISNQHRRVASRKIWSVEELQTLPASTKPRTPHHRSPGGEA